MIYCVVKMNPSPELVEDELGDPRYFFDKWVAFRVGLEYATLFPEFDYLVTNAGFNVTMDHLLDGTSSFPLYLIPGENYAT